MSTNTFERKITLTNDEDVKALMKIVESDIPKQALSEHPFSLNDRLRGEELLKRGLYH